jgi:hypothetical protein
MIKAKRRPVPTGWMETKVLKMLPKNKVLLKTKGWKVFPKTKG